MSTTMALGVDVAMILLFLGAFGMFRTPAGARAGNVGAAVSLALAALVVFLRNDVGSLGLVAVTLVLGSAAGWAVAARVSMVQIPALVAFQHGAGGIAACLVSAAELVRDGHVGWSVPKVSGLLGLLIGAATFSASFLAAGKLIGRLRQTPRILPRHAWIIRFTAGLAVLLTMVLGAGEPSTLAWGIPALLVVSVTLGLLVAIRVGGADMPVLISFLNATAGLAAAMCGVVIGNRLLVACGATVAASGSILTYVMCKAMNRSFANVLGGAQGTTRIAWLPQASSSDARPPQANELAAGRPAPDKPPLERAVDAAVEARTVVVVPGFGMALAQAQFEVVALARSLEDNGANVRFAVHPVAGRMPGHMNVLLAEADASYDRLIELEEANGIFPETDLVLVVGASDVVNPAAVETPDTPISGMPILKVAMSRVVVVCNLDDKPGYSGVPNTLYERSNVICLFGDAKQRVTDLSEHLRRRFSESRDLEPSCGLDEETV